MQRHQGFLRTFTRFGFVLLAVAALTLPAGASAVQQADKAPKPAKPTKGPKYKVLVVTAGAATDPLNVAGVSAIRAIGKDDGAKSNPNAKFSVVVVNAPAQINEQFTATNLAHYNVVIFLDTAGAALLTDAQKATFEAYFHSGGGFLGIGSAIETELGWQFYTDILGARSATTLAADSAVGDSNIKVAGVGGLGAGRTIAIDTGANAESATIQTVGTAGAAGTGVTLTAPLTLAHATGAKVALPQPAVQSGTIKVPDRVHDASKDLPEYWDRTDGWWNYTANVRGVSHVLATVVADPFGPQPQGAVLDGIEGSTMNFDHPVLWCKDYLGGRSFYSALGNTTGSFAEANFRTMLTGAIDWTAGVADKTYSDCGATVLRNYQQTKIGQPNLSEPIGFDQLPDGRIIQTDRRGGIRLHDLTTGTSRLITTIPVYNQSEDGMYGGAVDNDFATNKWVYLYYAPPNVDNITYSDGTTGHTNNFDAASGRSNSAGPTQAVNISDFDSWIGYFQLSRFKFVDDVPGGDPAHLDLASEQQIMRVTVNRGACCHVAGDIDFDKHGNLWLPTGDDTAAGSGDAGSFSQSIDQRTNENQTVRVTNATGGTFTLTFNGQTTAPLPFNATAAQIEPALAALSNIGTGNIRATGGPVNTANVLVTWRGTFEEQDVATLTSDATGLTGTTPTITIGVGAGAGGNNTSARQGGLWRMPAADAARSALNTNDLRGKVLRIKVKDTIAPADFNKADYGSGGAYTVPAGNLFPLVGGQPQAKTRAEIYAMGFRNPFRLQVDENDVVYISDYSNDNHNPAQFHGSPGIGRFQIVRHPANYGWPYCFSADTAQYPWNVNSAVPMNLNNHQPVPSSPSAAATVVGDSNIKVNTVAGFAVGDKLTIDTGANQESATILTVGTAGAAGTGITLTAPLTKAHASGITVIRTPVPYDCTNPAGIPNNDYWNLNGGPSVQAGLAVTPPITEPDVWYSYDDNRATNPLGTPCFASYGPNAPSTPIAPGSTTACPRLFPELFTNGVGPHGIDVYEYDPANPNPKKFPPYYDNSVILGEFTQDTMREMKLDSQNRVFKIATFLPCGAANSTTSPFLFECDNPMDMQWGADGEFYLLTYGDGFFNINADAGMYKWQYVKGQRAPVSVLTTDKTDGPLPLTVNFSSAGSSDADPGDSITFDWDFGDGTPHSIEPNPTHTYTTRGRYTVLLTVSDSSGLSSGQQTTITAGNTSPTVTVTTPVAGGTFDFGDDIPFTVSVTDPEDGAIVCSDIVVTFVLGHDTHGHAEGGTTGCSGVLHTDAGDVSHGGNVFGVVSATYTDHGVNHDNVQTLTTTSQQQIRQKHQEVEFVVSQSGTNTATNTDGGPTPPGTPGTHRGSLAPGDWIQLAGPYNLVNISGVTFRVQDTSARTAGTPLAAIEVHQDTLTGPTVATYNLVSSGGGGTTWTSQTFPISLSGTHELFLVFRAVTGGQTGNNLFNLNWAEFVGAGVGT